jgi:hypothetical protein
VEQSLAAAGAIASFSGIFHLNVDRGAQPKATVNCFRWSKDETLANNSNLTSLLDSANNLRSKECFGRTSMEALLCHVSRCR